MKSGRKGAEVGDDPAGCSDAEDDPDIRGVGSPLRALRSEEVSVTGVDADAIVFRWDAGCLWKEAREAVDIKEKDGSTGSCCPITKVGGWIAAGNVC